MVHKNILALAHVFLEILRAEDQLLVFINNRAGEYMPESGGIDCGFGESPGPKDGLFTPRPRL